MPKIKDLIKAGRDQASLKLRDQEEQDRVKVAAMERYSSSFWDKITMLWRAEGLDETEPRKIVSVSPRAGKKSRHRMQRESRRRNRA